MAVPSLAPSACHNPPMSSREGPDLEKDMRAGLAVSSLTSPRATEYNGCLSVEQRLEGRTPVFS